MAKVVIQEGLHKPKYILPGGRYHTHTNTHTGYLIQHVPHTNVLLTYTQTYEEIDKWKNNYSTYLNNMSLNVQVDKNDKTKSLETMM